MTSIPDSSNSVWGFSTAGRLIFGRGAAIQIGALVAKQGWKRGLVVTDAVLERLGYVTGILRSLSAAGLQAVVFAEVEPEPSVDTASRVAAFGAQHSPDFVIGLGGGSCIDTAKMAAVLLRFGGQPSDYFGFDRIPGAPLPLMAVPTTAGTGSEVSHSAVLTDIAAGIKVSTLSQFLRPAMAIVDPALTDSCPPQVTADSGIDALVHAIEAYSARDFSRMAGVSQEARAYEGAHPLGKTLALEAIRLIDQHLETAVHSGNNPAARDAMALAAMYAGMAFSNCGVAIVHALEYPLGALVHCSHGAGNGLLLPYVMQFNLPAAGESFAEIAIALGAPDASIPEQSQWLIQRIIDLRKRIGIPDRLRELGTPREAIPGLAAKSFKIERLMTLNPRPATEANLVQILTDAY